MTDVTDVIINRSVPAFIREDYPMFVAWLSSYYDFLQLTGNPLDIVNNFNNYSDIDATLDEFVTHFQKKYMPLIPANIKANPRLVAKHIKEFYSAKGTESSFRFLFRILYNEEIEFYLPSTNILKLSDGRWQQI